MESTRRKSLLTWRNLAGGFIALTCLVVVGQFAIGQVGDRNPDVFGPTAALQVPTYAIPGETQVSTLYHDGSEILIETGEVWRPMCGSTATDLTEDDIQAFAEGHDAIMKAGPVTVIDNTAGRAGFNLSFSLGGSVPSGAYDAFDDVEAYFEAMFSDNITVSISVTFQSMGGGVIGSTGPSYVSNVSYNTVRNSLQSGQDSDDFIEDYLPPGSTIPVRFNGSSSTVTNQSNVDFCRANYKAAIGTSSGSDASMTFNSDFNFDYDPSNGVGGAMSFVDTAIHEVGHALGFVSGADGFGPNFTAMDMYRFQRTDGGNDYNPDTYSELETTPRLVDYNNPNDDHNSDIIDAEYRMSDGSPYQASHFREQSSPWIGQMDPAQSYGETHYPTFFTSADINMFDIVGFDYPPCIVPQFTQQPPGVTELCAGGDVVLDVAVNIPNPGFQWQKGSLDLVDDGVHIFGATTDTLTIVNVDAGDTASNYKCLVTNLDDGCESTSNNVTVNVLTPATIGTQPVDLQVDKGALITISVSAAGTGLAYQWYHMGVPVVDDGYPTFGAQTDTLFRYDAVSAFTGEYYCEITGTCGDVTSDVAIIQVGAPCPGDVDCNGRRNFADINPFVAALVDGIYCDNIGTNADVDGNGSVGFEDINPFVELLTTNPLPIPCP